MEEILQEIRGMKTQQLAFNNLIVENGKQNEMILTVLREMLSELQNKEQDSLDEAIEKILGKLDVLIVKLSGLKEWIDL